MKVYSTKAFVNNIFSCVPSSVVLHFLCTYYNRVLPAFFSPMTKVTDFIFIGETIKGLIVSVRFIQEVYSFVK